MTAALEADRRHLGVRLCRADRQRRTLPDEPAASGDCGDCGDGPER